MIKLFFLFAFILSSFGMVIIVFKKIPVLVQKPENILDETKEYGLKEKIKFKFKNLKPFKNFSFNIFFQKILSKVRILTLRLENKIAGILQNMRTKNKNQDFDDENYWKNLKKRKISKKP